MLMDSQLSADCPNLSPEQFTLTSPQDSTYNCIAWVVGDDRNWWEPLCPAIVAPLRIGQRPRWSPQSRMCRRVVKRKPYSVHRSTSQLERRVSVSASVPSGISKT